nr:MAG TPA: hypothetical protein [Caudoviricetes sp.]
MKPLTVKRSCGFFRVGAFLFFAHSNQDLIKL